MLPGHERLVEAVQTNCHIADARHAADLTLCHYLLEMREFYRWEHGIGYAEQPPRSEVGKWIAEREALWETLEDADLVPVPVAGTEFRPFDAAGVNAALAPHGLVYGAGLGRHAKPQFYLGTLLRAERRGEVQILVAGCEYARDLASMPAGLSGNTVHVRLDSLKRWLWEKYEAWCARKPDGALRDTLLAYGFARDARAALERMASAECETLILHELGEFQAGRVLGDAWCELRSAITGRRAELVLRALRDNLADCLVTLPALLERRADASMHFWFSNFDGLRREFFPLLADAYASWRQGDAQPLHAAVRAGCDHWRLCCEFALERHRNLGGDAQAPIEALTGAPQVRL